MFIFLFFSFLFIHFYIFFFFFYVFNFSFYFFSSFIVIHLIANQYTLDIIVCTLLLHPDYMKNTCMLKSVHTSTYFKYIYTVLPKATKTSKH